MIVEKRIQQFEALGFGMFVHFGLYSALGKGEWALEHMTKEEYAAKTASFCPDPAWAAKLVAAAKSTGCKYITLTTRHHDGFSLYDTQGLNPYDAPHYLGGRDLVREFVDACNQEGIVPFFYHTLLDWSREDFETDFPSYLQYLRDSVRLLCTNYGKIGGVWFDGTWSKPEETDWEEDELYGMIRSLQPDAILVNNNGIGSTGALRNLYLDSVTFERGRPRKVNGEGAAKYVAGEMCQVFGVHWGYAERDFCYKSLAEIIEDLCVCRKVGANYLLNVGPMGNGLLRPLDEAMMRTLGEWTRLQSEALYLPRPYQESVEGNAKDFVLKKENTYYLFCHDLPMFGDGNFEINSVNSKYVARFSVEGKVSSVQWIDDGSEVAFSQEGQTVTVKTTPYVYGDNLVVRIAKMVVKP